MPAKKSAGRRRSTSDRTGKRRASKQPQRRKKARDARRSKNLIVRVVESRARGRTAEARAAAEPDVPEARIDPTGGTVSVEIAFGHAQHAAYTIQLFDPSGAELSRETGLSTDTLPDRFDLKLPPARLDQHDVQWQGSVDALGNAPGQRYSVIFDIRQDGSVVPGGHDEITGPLDVTQAFLGLRLLVAS